jgi:cell division septation protein DedD
MEPALKQRLVGAAVLVALAIIFLPMLIQGPAPESGIADVPLDAPSRRRASSKPATFRSWRRKARPPMVRSAWMRRP